MRITIDLLHANGKYPLALARALGIDVCRVEAIVTPPNAALPFCGEYRVVKSCGDVYAKIDGEALNLNIL